MIRFSVTNLQRSELDVAFPLVRMAASLMTMERWRSFASSLIDGDGGVLAARAGDQRPHGIAAYRLDENFRYGRVLHVEPLVSFELSPSAAVREALCEALEEIGLEEGCDRLIVTTGQRGYANIQSAKAATWAQLGLELESVSLVKKLAPPLFRPASIANPGSSD